MIFNYYRRRSSFSATTILWLALLWKLLLSEGFLQSPHSQFLLERKTHVISFSTQQPSGEAPSAPPNPDAPVLNGKRVLPQRIFSAGLKGHRVAAVYAILNSTYKRGADGWDAVEYVGVSQDVSQDVEKHLNNQGPEKVAHIRALSFLTPEIFITAMQEKAKEWRDLAIKAGSEPQSWASMDAMQYLYDEDDDDDDDDEDEDFMSMDMGVTALQSEEPQSVVSPFDTSSSQPASEPISTPAELAFTSENVDKVLDEIRPYLISDGGNVAVARIDEEKQDVFLKLEGACGSCPSSTVTMQMGIERVLKENFPNLGLVAQVEDDPQSQNQDSHWQQVEAEVRRLSQAIIAMGGVVKVLSVDNVEEGLVQLQFKGASRVKQGLELALLDIPFVERVEFVHGFIDEQ